MMCSRIEYMFVQYMSAPHERLFQGWCALQHFPTSKQTTWPHPWLICPMATPLLIELNNHPFVHDCFPGGGGALPYWVFSIFETPNFSPKFPLQSISFSHTHTHTKSAPEHHHFRVFTALETIIFKMSLSSSCFIAAHGRFTSASPNTKRLASAPGLQPARVPARRILHVSSGDPQFHARACSRAPHFHARAAPEPPIFQFAIAHTYQNVGRVPPPPPPPGLFYSFHKLLHQFSIFTDYWKPVLNMKWSNS